MDVHFGCLTAGQIDEFWPKCKGILKRAFHNKINIYTVDDFYQPLKAGHLHLWAAVQNNKVIGAVITEIQQGSAMRVCEVLSIAGSQFKEWASAFDKAISDYAAQNNCQAIQAVTRKGFSKFLPDLQEDGVVYVRILK